MKLPPSARRFALAVHLTSSTSWIGAILAYLPFDLTVLTSNDPDTVRAAWAAMGTLATAVILPLAVASFLTGVVLAVGTPWGLLRHWWVVVSLVLTLFALLVLVVETSVITRAAATAAALTTADEPVLTLPSTLPHSLGGLAVLLVVQFLNVYKPPGLTPYGSRRQQVEQERRGRRAMPGGLR